MSNQTSISIIETTYINLMENRGLEELELRIRSYPGLNLGSSSRIGWELVSYDMELVLINKFEQELPIVEEHIITK